MHISVNVIGQTLAAILQGLNAVGQFTSGKTQFWIASAIGLVQLGISVVAHFSNVPGTTAIPNQTK